MINGRTALIMLARVSTRWGMPKSFVKMAIFKAGRDGISVACLSAPKPIYKKLSHCKKVQAVKYDRRCPLQTTFEQAKIKTWLVD